MRNLIFIAKILPNVDSTVDAVVARLSRPRDLCDFVDATHSGKAILYWASYYDSWSMAQDIDVRQLGLNGRCFARDMVEIDLTNGPWENVDKMDSQVDDWSQSKWFRWHLQQAYRSFSMVNANARLIIGREVLEVSLDDSEVSGGRAPET